MGQNGDVMRLLVIMLIGTYIVSIQLAGAQLIPPQQFYGHVYIHGTKTVEAPDGLIVQALINGKVVATCNTSDGKYGYSPDVLKVQGEEGDVVRFLVNGIDTGQSANFVSGEFTQLDLTVQDNTPPEIISVKVEPAETGIGGEVSINVEARDELAGIERIVVRIYNESYEERIELTDLSGIWRSSAEGEYLVDVIAEDRAGNVEEKRSVSTIEVMGYVVSTPTSAPSPNVTATPIPTITPTVTPTATPEIPEKMWSKIVSIAEIRNNPYLYAGKEVIITGIYLGWHGNESPPVTRSDWAIQDETGQIYVTGKSPNLDPIKNVGTNIMVVGYVEVTADGRPYVNATDVKVLVLPTTTVSPTSTPKPTPTKTPKPLIPGFELILALIAFVIAFMKIRRN